jgi:hypothetical protein
MCLGVRIKRVRFVSFFVKGKENSPLAQFGDSNMQGSRKTGAVGQLEDIRRVYECLSQRCYPSRIFLEKLKWPPSRDVEIGSHEK